jgi:MtrB/PioB family decaheme-associated outer membrane protein
MTRSRIATIVRLALPMLVCSILLPRMAAAQMVYHFETVLETLQTDQTTHQQLNYRSPNEDVQSSKFQEYRDLSSGFRLQQFHLFGDDAGAQSRYVDIHGTNVGRKDERIGLQAGTWGGWAVDVDYNSIVHNFGNGGVFLWNRTAPGVFDIPDASQAAVQAAIEHQYALNPLGITYPFLHNLLDPYLRAANRIDVGLERHRTDVTLELGKMANLGWALQMQHENRVGTREFGGSFGFGNASEIVEPIDYKTDNAELRGEWKSKDAGAQFGLRYSRFQNSISTLYWDNPFRATNSTDPSAYTAPGPASINGSSTGFADLAPDNQSTMGFFNGRMKFAGSWYADGRVSYNQMRQDDALLPYTLNSSIQGIAANGSKFDPTNPANLPAHSANRKVDVSDIAANVGGKLGDAFDLAFRYRYYDYDNKSPEIEFPGYVRFHAVWENVARVTAPYSYKKQIATGELGWNLGPSTNLQLALERRTFDRDLAETTRTNEDALRLTGVTTAVTNFALRGTYEHGRRDISGTYDTSRGANATFPDPETPTNLPGMRKFNQAERGYDLWNVQADWTINDRMTLTGTTQGRKDDYDKSEFGLTESKVATFGLEWAWEITDRSNLFAFYNRDKLEYVLDSRQSGAVASVNPADSWSGDFTDDTDTFGLGWSCTHCDRWDVQLTSHYSKTDGNADLFSPPGGAPDVAYPISNYDDVKLWSSELVVDYHLNERFSIGLSYLYEDYKIDSFRKAGLDPFLAGAPLLDLANGSYTGNVFGAHLKFAM